MTKLLVKEYRTRRDKAIAVLGTGICIVLAGIELAQGSLILWVSSSALFMGFFIGFILCIKSRVEISKEEEQRQAYLF